MYQSKTLYKLLQNLLELRRNEKMNSIDYLSSLQWAKLQALKSYREDKINATQYLDITEIADKLVHAEHCHCGNWQ